MTPFVSFVFPVAHDAVALELLRRSVHALRAQTAPPALFEVVVAVDGGPAVDVGLHPFTVRVVTSPRTAGNEHLPHRNHARNAGCRAARGEYLWVLDGDMIADPLAVEHLLAITVGMRSTKPRVVSPCFAEIACTPAEWLATGDVGAYRVRRKVVSGQLERHAPGPPASVHLPMLVEGFPAVPRWLFEAIGGFDERYLGWGGNKIDLCRRLRLLDLDEGLLEIHLLTSVLFRHQPHDRDPFHFHEELRATNTAMFEAMQNEARAGAPWWRAQVEAVRRASRAAA